MNTNIQVGYGRVDIMPVGSIELGGLVEATPAVYGNKLVVGTRNEKIICVQIG